jgi:hypothetical protein
MLTCSCIPRTKRRLTVRLIARWTWPLLQQRPDSLGCIKGTNVTPIVVGSVARTAGDPACLWSATATTTRCV